MKWNCCVPLCYNNFTTIVDGKLIRKYKLPQDKAIQDKYSAILKTNKINWKKGYICAEHWEKGYRENTSDLPDYAAPKTQVDKI